MKLEEIKGETVYNLTLTAKQLRFLRYCATYTKVVAPMTVSSANSFLDATENTEAAKIPVDFNVRF